MSTSTDCGTDADDWRGRDWRRGDRVEVCTHAGCVYVGWIVGVVPTLLPPASGALYLSRGFDDPFEIAQGTIASMVRLVPEQPQTATPPTPTPDLQRRIESLEQATARHRERLATLDGHAAAQAVIHDRVVALVERLGEPCTLKEATALLHAVRVPARLVVPEAVPDDYSPFEYQQKARKRT